jgi:hypothetical protein
MGMYNAAAQNRDHPIFKADRQHLFGAAAEIGWHADARPDMFFAGRAVLYFPNRHSETACV